MGLLTDALASGQAGQAGTAGNGAGEKAKDRYMASDMTPDANDQAASAVTGHEPGSDHELDAFLGKAFKEEPIWVGLWASVKDVFFPVKLPPLVLTSTPIPVPDRMAVKANPWAIGISIDTQYCSFAAVHLAGHSRDQELRQSACAGDEHRFERLQRPKAAKRPAAAAVAATGASSRPTRASCPRRRRLT